MHTRTGLRAALPASLTALALALTACGGAASSSTAESTGPQTPAGQQMAALHQAAVASGKTTLTVYGPGATSLQPHVEAFNKQFPDISVELVTLVGADLITRLNGEVTSGQHTADVAFGPANQGVFTPEYDRWFTAFAPEGRQQLPPSSVQSQNLWNCSFSAGFGLAYNTEKVADADAPADWAVLATPAWRGRIGMDDPKVASATSIAMAFAVADGQIDDAWMQAFAANDPKITVGLARRGQALTTGEVDAAIYPLGVMTSDVANGAPLKWAGGTTVTVPHAMGIIDGAPNLDAARLWSTWLLSPEGQAAAAAEGNIPLMPDAPHPAEGLRQSKPVSAQEFGQIFPHVLKVWAGLLP